LAARRERSPSAQSQSQADLEQIGRRVKMLDDRLDNLDSIVTSLVHRVMEKPLTLEITCPNCSQTFEVNITSNIRLRGKA
jgi:hypothetical protein